MTTHTHTHTQTRARTLAQTGQNDDERAANVYRSMPIRTPCCINLISGREGGRRGPEAGLGFTAGSSSPLAPARCRRPAAHHYLAGCYNCIHTFLTPATRQAAAPRLGGGGGAATPVCVCVCPKTFIKTPDGPPSISVCSGCNERNTRAPSITDG